MTDPIRVFVGCAANGEDAESQAVLEYTLRKHASRPVELVWMKLSRDPRSPFAGWTTSAWSTPFTGFRWGIPAFCGFKGRAIYTDSDVIHMADIAELYDQPMGKGKVLKARGTEGKVRYCVMLIDCAEAKKYLPPLQEIKNQPKSNKRMTDFFRSRPDLCQKFDGNWNCIDGDEYEDLHQPDIKCIHYSWMNHQPHHKFAGPRLARDGRTHWFDGRIAPHWRQDMEDLFDGLLVEAEAAGYPVSKYYDPSKPIIPFKGKSYKDSKLYGEK